MEERDEGRAGGNKKGSKERKAQEDQKKGVNPDTTERHVGRINRNNKEIQVRKRLEKSMSLYLWIVHGKGHGMATVHPQILEGRQGQPFPNVSKGVGSNDQGITQLFQESLPRSGCYKINCGWLLIKPHIYEQQCRLRLSHGKLDHHVVNWKLFRQWWRFFNLSVLCGRCCKKGVRAIRFVWATQWTLEKVCPAFSFVCIKHDEEVSSDISLAFLLFADNVVLRSSDRHLWFP